MSSFSIVDTNRMYDEVQDRFLALLRIIRKMPAKRREWYYRKADNALNLNNSAFTQLKALRELEKEIAR